jgi:hypothetical protein
MNITNSIRNWAAGRKYSGRIDKIEVINNRCYAYGWICNMAKPEQPVQCSIVFNQNELAQLTADQYRADLAKAGIGNGFHAFSRVMVGDNLPDATLRNLRILPNGATKPLRHHEYAITFSKDDCKEGNIDRIDLFGPVTKIYGWIWDPSAPDDPVEAGLETGNHNLARILANQEREDLRRAGKGNGKHGFTCLLPRGLTYEEAENLRLQDPLTTAAVIQGDRRNIICRQPDAPEAINFLMQQAEDSLKGNEPGRAVSIYNKLVLIRPDDPELPGHLKRALDRNGNGAANAGFSETSEYQQDLKLVNSLLDEIDHELVNV